MAVESSSQNLRGKLGPGKKWWRPQYIGGIESLVQDENLWEVSAYKKRAEDQALGQC